MSNEAIRWAYEHVKVTEGGNAGLVLMWLACRHRPGKILSYPLRHMSEELGIADHKTVARALSKLERLHLISKHSGRFRRGQTVMGLNIDLTIEVNEKGEVSVYDAVGKMPPDRPQTGPQSVGKMPPERRQNPPNYEEERLNTNSADAARATSTPAP